MTEYTNAEKADMILAHGATDCNGRATQRLYAEKHPVRRTPAHTMFARLHQQLCGTGSFQKAARTELNEEIVLDMVETTPSLSTRGIANEIGISYSSVWRILDDSALHPFHYQYVQSLKECDFAPRQAFPQWYLQQRIANPFFEASVLFTDEASFSREGIFNTHNSHSGSSKGPYILPGHLTGPRYLIFLEQVLPKLLDRAHVTAAIRTSMWFQQDGAPHISVFLFGITWMQYVVNDGLAVEVQCIDFSDRQTFPVWIISSGANEIVGVRNTRKQRRGTCSTHQCSSRGNTKHSEMLSNVRRSMKRRCEACIT
ncbi:DUF4817 domain-containing protein [Trichonephila clavipes]|uniref:DUF4817 domain-containing protein n=1 Tax=Trichonephila clavipes TaxID=2585209 RepID=A0A8X7BCA2_TRICX|nr:DUF4817 domain-containing protein [Trichonephila clavipes]